MRAPEALIFAPVEFIWIILLLLIAICEYQSSASTGVGICLANLAKDKKFL